MPDVLQTLLCGHPTYCLTCVLPTWLVPKQESALSALDTIKPADIKLVQSFKNPPGAIKLVCSGELGLGHQPSGCFCRFVMSAMQCALCSCEGPRQFAHCGSPCAFVAQACTFFPTLGSCMLNRICLLRTCCVHQVMEAVCVLLDVKPTRVKDPGGSGKMIDDYWVSAQKVLTDPNFIKTLKEFDKDNVNAKVGGRPWDGPRSRS